MRGLKAASWAAVVALVCSLLVVSGSTGASALSGRLSSAGPSRVHGTTAVPVTGSHPDLTGAVLTRVTWGATLCPDGVRIQTAPCPPLVPLGTSTVATRSDTSDGTLLVDVGPALSGGGQWRALVQRLSSSGGWVTVETYPTRGPGDTVRVTLPAGTYRAVVWPQKRYRGSASAAVVLAR